MNQQEYTIISATLRTWYKLFNVEYFTYHSLVTALADSFEQYKSFDRAKFLKACGVSK